MLNSPLRSQTDKSRMLGSLQVSDFLLQEVNDVKKKSAVGIEEITLKWV